MRRYMVVSPRGYVLTREYRWAYRCVANAALYTAEHAAAYPMLELETKYLEVANVD